MNPYPPRSTLFPYTTLFRSVYASDPLSCPVALICTLLPGLRVLYHEHDSPQSNTSGNWFATFVGYARRSARSEEHTSELQSLTNLVCRLLLEKKNKY